MSVKAFLSSILKGDSKKNNQKGADADTDGEDSPINRMLKRKGKKLPYEALDQYFSDSPEHMTDAEKQALTDALIPRRHATIFKKVLKETDKIFPTTVEEAKRGGGTPTMDAAHPYNGYPPQNGKNAGIDSSGLGMMPDPLMRFPINPRVLKHFQSRIWITYSGCAIISTHEFVSRACMIPAEDAMSPGYKVVCASRDHGNDDDEHIAKEDRFLFDVKEAADDMGINEACIKLNYKKKVFGVGIAIPRVKFKKDYPSPSDKSGKTQYSYEDEYDPKAIEPRSYEGFAVIDPQWLTYEFDAESSQDPMSPHFYVPTWIMVGNRKIHRSWIIRVINSEIPDLLKPTYYFGGLSLTQMIYERVWCADKLANEAPLLAMTKRLLIADGNLEQMIGDPKHTNIFFRAINYFRDNFSIFVKKPSSNVTQLDTSLAELTPLTMSQYQLVAAIAQIPVTKLLKNVPSGLQATGQYEWDDYAQSLRAIQEHDYTPLVKRHYELYVASNYPDRKDLDLSITWNPIDVPKETEVVSMASQFASFATTLLGNGVVTVNEARSILRNSHLPVYNAIAADTPPIIERLEEAKDPKNSPQQGGMMGGMMPPGMGVQPGMGGGGQPGMMPPHGMPPPQDVKKEQSRRVDPIMQKNDEAFKNILREYNLLPPAGQQPQTDGTEAQQQPQTEAPQPPLQQ